MHLCGSLSTAEPFVSREERLDPIWEVSGRGEGASPPSQEPKTSKKLAEFSASEVAYRAREPQPSFLLAPESDTLRDPDPSAGGENLGGSLPKG